MSDKRYKIGYTTGVFDLFHVGHLNILRCAKEQCDHLIVGVSTDELVEEYKHKRPVIPYEERCAIVQAIRYVDEVVPQTNRDKVAAFEKYHFDAVFVGDDWKDSPEFHRVDEVLRQRGGCVEYIPYTQNISSTMLKKVLEDLYARK